MCSCAAESQLLGQFLAMTSNHRVSDSYHLISHMLLMSLKAALEAMMTSILDLSDSSRMGSRPLFRLHCQIAHFHRSEYLISVLHHTCWVSLCCDNDIYVRFWRQQRNGQQRQQQQAAPSKKLKKQHKTSTLRLLLLPLLLLLGHRRKHKRKLTRSSLSLSPLRLRLKQRPQQLHQQ